MKKFGTLDSSGKMISKLGDRWCPQTAKKEGDKISVFVCSILKKRTERPNVMIEVRTMLCLESDM